MRNVFTNIKLLLGYNSKLYNLALEYYRKDVKAEDKELDALYNLILKKLIYPVGQKDAKLLMESNKRNIHSPFGRIKLNQFESLNAEIQSHQNKGVLLELKALHRSEKFMHDFLQENKLRIETDPFGYDELVADDDISKREILFSPLMILCSKGKKAILKRFEGESAPSEQEK